MNTTSPTTTRDTCLQWWASHDGHTAAQVADHFNGDGAEDLAEGAGPIKPATLRQWKARHGLPATPSATKSTPKPAPLADPIQAAAVQPAAVWIDVGDVVPWVDNPRDNDDAAERVAESIARFGYGRAFVGWRPDGERMLVVGHTARKASLILRDRRPVYAFQTDGEGCRGCGQSLDGKHAAGCAVAIPPEVPREGMIPMRWRADWTEAEARAYAIADNQLGSLSEWMPDLLAEQLADLEQHDLGPGLLGWDTGADIDALLADLKAEIEPKADETAEPKTEESPGPSLVERFGVPPFSILDAKQGYWVNRKKEWLNLGIRSEEGRDGVGHTSSSEALNIAAGIKHHDGGSIFDPVLMELACRWFAPPGGQVLDPFAGGSVRGVVAAALGYQYTGIDLRNEQILANRAQWTEISPKVQIRRTVLEDGEEAPPPIWHQGDSQNMDQLLPAGQQYDLVMTCPPYADLEVYSDDPADISNMDYAAFTEAYKKILAAALGRLKENRFIVVVIGDVRDKRGNYLGVVRLTEEALIEGGAGIYNVAILLSPLGNVPMRAGGHFKAGRKLSKVHQNVIIGYKGDPRKIRHHLGEPPEWIVPESEVED